MTHRPLPAFVRRLVTAIVAFGLAANAAAMQIFVKDPSGKTIGGEVAEACLCAGIESWKTPAPCGRGAFGAWNS